MRALSLLFAAIVIAPLLSVLPANAQWGTPHFEFRDPRSYERYERERRLQEQREQQRQQRWDNRPEDCYYQYRTQTAIEHCIRRYGG